MSELRNVVSAWFLYAKNNNKDRINATKLKKLYAQLVDMAV